VIEPAEGEMACGEFGPGRLPEPQDIVDWLGKNGLLTVELPEKIVQRLWDDIEENPQTEVTIEVTGFVVGPAFAGLARRFGAFELTENRRQQHAWERAALADLRAGRIADAFESMGRGWVPIVGMDLVPPMVPPGDEGAEFWFCAPTNRSGAIVCASSINAAS